MTSLAVAGAFRLADARAVWLISDFHDPQPWTVCNGVGR